MKNSISLLVSCFSDCIVLLVFLYSTLTKYVTKYTPSFHQNPTVSSSVVVSNVPSKFSSDKVRGYGELSVPVFLVPTFEL